MLSTSDAIALGALVLAVGIPVVKWLWDRAHNEGRQEAQRILDKKRDAEFDAMKKLVADLDKRSAVDHQTVDGFCARLDDMRADMDKRFDGLRADIDKNFARVFAMLSKRDR